jgi:hypothetical protein
VRRWFGGGVAAVLVALGLSGAPVARADSVFTVTPAFQDATVSGTTSVDLSIQLSNHTPADQSFALSVADFGSLNESGGVAFLGTTPNELDRPYGLVSWLQLDRNVAFVPAGGTVTIGVTVENRDSLSPGGHYGAVLATAVTDTGTPQNVGTQIGLHEVLSSLILVTKTGGALPDLKLVSESFQRSPLTLPNTLLQRFQDAGNQHVVPRGTVEIRDPLGRLVKSGALNENSFFILPESFRQIPVDLITVGHSWLPGRYTITTEYRYDGTEATKTFKDSVWYVGAAAVLVAWITLGVVILGAGGWWWWRRKHPKRRS